MDGKQDLINRKCKGKNCKNSFRCYQTSTQEYCRRYCNPHIDPFTGLDNKMTQASPRSQWKTKKIDKPSEVKLIQRLRYLYTETKLTALQICKLMTAEGFVTVTGKALCEPWAYMTAKRIGISKRTNGDE